MNRLTKKQLLQSTDSREITKTLIDFWPGLLDEEQRELCLESIYELLADNAPLPDNFNLLSNDEKAQYEIDVDMLLITIDYYDLKTLIFDDGENELYFWSNVGDRSDKTNKKIYKALFS